MVSTSNQTVARTCDNVIVVIHRRVLIIIRAVLLSSSLLFDRILSSITITKFTLRETCSKQGQDVKSEDRDETKTFQKTSRDRMQCCSLKILTGEVCHLTTCFLQFRSIIFFLSSGSKESYSSSLLVVLYSSTWGITTGNESFQTRRGYRYNQ